MKNKLEEFVNEHRDEFDTDMPGRNVWDTIDKTPARSKNKIVSFFTRTRVAASILILVSAAVIIVLLQRKPETAPGTVVASAIPASAVPAEQATDNKVLGSEKQLDQISKELEIQQAALKEIKRTNPSLYKKFTSSLNELSIAYKELEKELDNNPNKEQLLEAMIQNLNLQQELLNQQLSIYQKVKQNPHEKVNKNI